MNDFFLNLVVIAVTAIIVITIFILVNQARKKKQEVLIQMAKEEGWEFVQIKERLSWGFRLETALWRYVVLSQSKGIESGSGSSNIQLSTKWSSKQPFQLSGFTMMGPRSNVSVAGTIGEMLIQNLFEKFLGDDNARYGNIIEFNNGHEHLLKKWMVWTSNSNEVEKVFSPDLDHALVKWQGKQLPVIKISSAGISFEFQGIRLEKPDEIYSVVRLGEVFLKSFADQ